MMSLTLRRVFLITLADYGMTQPTVKGAIVRLGPGLYKNGESELGSARACVNSFFSTLERWYDVISCFTFLLVSLPCNHAPGV